MKPGLNLLRFHGNVNNYQYLINQQGGQQGQFRGFYMNGKFNQSMFANIANSRNGCSSCGK
jgi:hypothetical protein